MMRFVTAAAVFAGTAAATNASFDLTNNKVIITAHGLSNDNLVLYLANGGTAQNGLADKTVYVVAAKTDNDFQLKAASTAMAATGDALAMTDSAKGTYQNTISLVGTKKCALTGSAADNKIKAAAACALTTTDVMYIYCTDAAAASCKLDGAANAKLNGQLLQIKIKADGDANAGTGAVFTDTSGTDIAIATPIADVTAKPIFLLSKDAKVLYPVTTPAPTSGYNVFANNISIKAHGLANDTIVLYTKGTDGTAQSPLTDKTAYLVSGQTTNTLQLKTFKAADATADALVTLTATTAGTYQNRLAKIGTKKCKLTGSAADNKIKAAAACALTTTDVMYIYCTDAAAASCKLDGAANAKVNGQLLEIKIKADGDANAGTGAVFTDASGTDIAIATPIADVTAKPIWLLSKDAGDALAPLITTTGAPTTTVKPNTAVPTTVRENPVVKAAVAAAGGAAVPVTTLAQKITLAAMTVGTACDTDAEMKTAACVKPRTVACTGVCNAAATANNKVVCSGTSANFTCGDLTVTRRALSESDASRRQLANKTVEVNYTVTFAGATAAADAAAVKTSVTALTLANIKAGMDTAATAQGNYDYGKAGMTATIAAPTTTAYSVTTSVESSAGRLAVSAVFAALWVLMM